MIAWYWILVFFVIGYYLGALTISLFKAQREDSDPVVKK